MRCERIELTSAGETAARLRGLVPAADQVTEAVAQIIARVAEGGDNALNEYTRLFDTDGAPPPPLRADTADADLAPAVAHGLEQAAANVRRVAEAALTPDRSTDLQTHWVKLRTVPVDSAAIYVPGGRAPYPSTVVMGVVTARVAGVRHVLVCSPPSTSADVHPSILAASRLAGASAVYRMGGAQAIAALAHGTETVPRVDVLVGPGNLYVQEAKRQLSARVGIDGFAGPSDLVVIAAGDADPEITALDLLAQAEHGPGTLVVAISASPDLLEAIASLVSPARDTGAAAALVHAPDAEHALELAQAIAPEHLQLVGAESEALAPRVTSAGCLFVGAAAGTAFGDYIAGSNHILPTAGSARFASALSPQTFRRTFYEVRVSDSAPLARAAAPIAREEGFELHARSMEARTRHNGRTP